MMNAGTGQTGLSDPLDSTVYESIASVATSQEYIDQLILDLLENVAHAENIVATLITSQNEIDQLVEDLLKNAAPAAN